MTTQMMKTNKKFEIVVSRKYSNGNIISVRFGTEITDDIDIQSDNELFAHVYTGTMEDIKSAVADNKMVRSVMKSADKSVKRELKIEKAMEE